MRFGAITPEGESLLLSEALLDELASKPCWLDGAVRVRLERRRLTEPHPWLEALARPDRAPLVEALADLLRSRHLARRSHGVPGDGRRPDPRQVPVRAVRARPGGSRRGWPTS